MQSEIVNLPGEVWKPVGGYEGAYAISTCGRVASLRRTIPHQRVKSKVVPGGLLALTTSANTGYIGTSLCRGGSQVRRHIHRLVLEAFVGPCPPGMEACHNDGNRTNNRLENLRWDTRAANVADRKRHGTNQQGENHARATITEEDVRAMRAAYDSGEELTAIAKRTGRSYACVRCACLRISWKCVA